MDSWNCFLQEVTRGPGKRKAPIHFYVYCSWFAYSQSAKALLLAFVLTPVLQILSLTVMTSQWIQLIGTKRKDYSHVTRELKLKHIMQCKLFVKNYEAIHLFFQQFYINIFIFQKNGIMLQALTWTSVGEICLCFN